MQKIIKPCFTGKTNTVPTYIKISYVDKKLSISGVEGPKSSGDCFGSCGQIYDNLLNSEPNIQQHWTKKKIQKLVQIWKDWHLNDMTPYCEHQKDWNFKEVLHVIPLHYTDKGRYIEKKVKYNDASEEEKELVSLADKVYRDSLGFGDTFYNETEIKILLDKNILSRGEPVQKIAGWVQPSQHSKGLLGKPCSICGYKYGTSWLFKEVPKNVIDWLFALPETDTKPAWI